MRSPIIVKDDTPSVMVFSSPENAGGYMEDYDIAIYEAWDADGTRLTLSAGPGHTVAFADSGRNDENGLRAAILRAFASKGETADAKDPLSELVDRAAEAFREDRPASPSRLGSLISSLFSRHKRSA